MRGSQLLADYQQHALGTVANDLHSYDHRYGLAAAHAIQGEKAQAVRWLQEAVSLGFRDYWLLMNDPLLENVRDMSEFARLAGTVRSQIDQTRARVMEMERPRA